MNSDALPLAIHSPQTPGDGSASCRFSLQRGDQIVNGAGEWRDGHWRVIFARDLTVDGDYSQFAEGDSTSITLAAWDGDSEERDGMKSVSQFLTLEVSQEVAEKSGGVTVWIIVAVVLGGVALALVLAMYGRRRQEG